MRTIRLVAFAFVRSTPPPFSPAPRFAVRGLHKVARFGLRETGLASRWADQCGCLRSAREKAAGGKQSARARAEVLEGDPPSAQSSRLSACSEESPPGPYSPAPKRRQ
jgi:hypothetical protein